MVLVPIMLIFCMSVLTDRFVLHGKPPYNLVFLHGGPGAGGELAGLAEDISSAKGVIEPRLYSLGITEQLEYLSGIITRFGDQKVVLAGYSWGAWLGIMLAGTYPQLISKLILVSCPLFQSAEAKNIMDTRLRRMDEGQKNKLATLTRFLAEAENDAMADESLAEIGKLVLQVDAYSPLYLPDAFLECSYKIYKSIWQEALKLRLENKFEEYLSAVKCPVVAIHGDYDPHPARPVLDYLANHLERFSAVLLKRCGHCPWQEKYAREEFIACLQKEI